MTFHIDTVITTEKGNRIIVIGGDHPTFYLVTAEGYRQIFESQIRYL